MRHTKIKSEKTFIEVLSPQIEEPEKKLTKLDVIKKLSSGTELREGLNNIVSGGMGAIIVVAKPGLGSVIQGGFRVNCKFSAKRLFELAKMDGAIILSEDFKKILYANTLLVPDKNLSSSETGIRHQTAERTAKQINGLVIAVSERRGVITVYYSDSKYVLQHTETLLRRATENLQILEKQKEIFNELLVNLNILELTSLVSVGDVCKVLQRIEMVKKIANMINEYILELGKDGVILRMRMKEIIRGIEKEEGFIIKDYVNDFSKATKFFEELNFDEILDSENIGENLFGLLSEEGIVPKGYRILGKTGLTKEEIENLIREFGNLDSLINSGDERLVEVLKDRASVFKKEFLNLKEQIMVGKRV